MFIEQFLDWAYSNLLENEEAQSYLLGRGISKEQWLTHKIGYVSADFDVDPEIHPGHSESCSDPEKKHLRCDACRYRNWSSTWEMTEIGKIQRVGRRIHGCVVFPITSYSGQNIGFQTRSITQKDYDTFAITRRPEGYFFGCSVNFQEIWATQSVILVEGPGDQLIMERLVSPNVLAITTSSLSKFQTQYVRRFVRKVILCLDMDAAGRKGARSFIEQYQSNFDIVDVKYPCIGPKDKDVGDYWKKVGDDNFARYFKKILEKNT